MDVAIVSDLRYGTFAAADARVRLVDEQVGTLSTRAILEMASC